MGGLVMACVQPLYLLLYSFVMISRIQITVYKLYAT